MPVFLGFSCGSAGKESVCNVGDLGLIHDLGRSLGEGKGFPFQYPGEFHGLYGLQDHKELNTTKQLSFTHLTYHLGKNYKLLEIKGQNEQERYVQKISCYAYENLKVVISSLSNASLTIYLQYSYD